MQKQKLFKEIMEAIPKGTEAFKEAVKGKSNLKAIVNTQDDKGNTPLHLAAVNGNVDIVKWLLVQGAGVNAQDGKGNTPLIKTSGIDNPQMVAMLISKGADVNACNGIIITPLHKAVSLGSVEIVKILLAYGAKTDVVDSKSGKALLDLSIEKGNSTITDLLNKAQTSEGRGAIRKEVMEQYPTNTKEYRQYKEHQIKENRNGAAGYDQIGGALFKSTLGLGVKDPGTHMAGYLGYLELYKLGAVDKATWEARRKAETEAKQGKIAK